jgi:signal transduction histidine kinase
LLAALGAIIGGTAGLMLGSAWVAAAFGPVGALLGGLVGVLVGLAFAPSESAPSVEEEALAVLVRDGTLPESPEGEPDGVAAVRRLLVRVEQQAQVEGELRAELQEASKAALREKAKAQMAAGSVTGAHDAFLMRMSHELRTPLNAILGYADMLVDELEDDELISDAVRIRQAGRHLLGLVTAVLDLTQMQSGRHAVEPEPVDLKALVDEVVDGVRPVADEHRNELQVSVQVDAQPWLDRRMVQSILFNLVHNGAKYTKDGMVTVRVTVSDQTAEIFVGDTGIGMTERQVEQAFVPFGQADMSTTRAYDGTGLGLAVCRGFAEAMGGELAVDSKIGEGARITVTLPRRVKARMPGDDPSDERTMIMR